MAEKINPEIEALLARLEKEGKIAAPDKTEQLDQQGNRLGVRTDDEAAKKAEKR